MHTSMLGQVYICTLTAFPADRPRSVTSEPAASIKQHHHAHSFTTSAAAVPLDC